MQQSTDEIITTPDETSDVFTMVVTLKSGAQIRTRVTEYTVQRNGLRALVGLKWEPADGNTVKIEFLDVDEVAAIHSEF